MKKTIPALLLVVLTAGAATRALAQVPAGITINAAGDTIWNSWQACQAPDTVGIYLYGTGGGYLPGDSVTVNIAFGDGTDTTYMLSLYQGVYFTDYFPHIYQLPGIYSQQFIVTGPNGAADTVVNANGVIIASQCGNLSGKVYYDDNGDCAFNGNDAPMPWVFVRLLYQGTFVQGVYTDVNGNYFMSVPAGFTYTVETAYTNANFTALCPASGSYTVSSFPSANNDFSTVCSVTGHDLAGYLHAWGFRPGFNANVYFHFWNTACNPVSGTATITLPPGLSYVSGTPAPANVSGNVITYNVSPYPFYWSGWWSGSNYITVAASPSLTIGDTLCVQMQLDPVSGDLNPADNLVAVCAPVRNSCDPNEKFEKHAFWGTAPVAPGTPLEYTVFFQNVGNDVAYAVNIVDTLDSDLIPESLRITSTSHPMTLRKQGADVLKFEFLNINLPAASVNEPLSHGFVSYSVMPKAGLAQGTPVVNRAHIVFDFNGPIETNAVTDIIDMALGVPGHLLPAPATAFPNPATAYLGIRNAGDRSGILTLADVQGRVVRRLPFAGDDRLYVGDLSEGFYLIRWDTDSRTFIGRVAVTR